MRYLLGVLIVLLSGCVSLSHKKELPKELRELSVTPQSADYYLQNYKDEEYISTLEEFSESYFAVWNEDNISVSLEDARWFGRHFTQKKTYGFTLQPLDKTFYEKLEELANWEDFGSVNKVGVTTATVDVRAMPSDEVVFLDPQKAGEGYPFDYLQNTLLAANKPVRISHYSKDKEWVFVEFSFGFGWVHVKDIVTLPARHIQQWRNAYEIFLLKDNYPLYDAKGSFLFRSRVGMLLPLISEDEYHYRVLVVSKEKETLARYHEVLIPKTVAHDGIMKFSAKNISEVLTQLQKGKYGWGGIYKQRDCSSTLRDFFTPFGIWLPRNSSKQAQVGEVIGLAKLSNKQKEKLIQSRALPFKTLLYKRGHIGLYVGVYQNKAIIFQNVWGIKTKDEAGEEGRYIIAKPVFSTLELGKELPNFDINASMLSKLQSFNIVTE